MKWSVIESSDQVDVFPTADDGTYFFHVFGSDCLCEPAVENHLRRLVTHNLTNRLYVMRAWTLRRELRGKRGGVR